MTNIFKSLTKESEFDRAFRHMNQIQNARLEMRRRRLARAIEENKRLKLEKENLPFQLTTILTMDKYKKKTANALAIGERIFTLKAISSLNGIIDAILPSNKKRGLPGGCGTPKV